MGQRIWSQRSRFTWSRRLRFRHLLHLGTKQKLILVGAKDAYEEALKVEPGNAQAKSGLKAVEDTIAREAQEDGQEADIGLGNVFTRKDCWECKYETSSCGRFFYAKTSICTKKPQIIATGSHAGFAIHDCHGNAFRNQHALN